MDENASNRSNLSGIDFNNVDVDSLPAELLDKIEKARREKAKETLVHLRRQVLVQEQLHLHGDADVIDSYGRTIAALAKDRGKEGVTLAECMTIMQEDLLRKAITNLDRNGIIKVVKRHPDGEDSGNKKYLYLPEFVPARN